MRTKEEKEAQQPRTHGLTVGPRNWRNQFGDEYQVPKEITEKFADISWGNDACPAFTHTGSKDDDWGGWRLWVEHPDLGRREFPDDSKRFIVVFDRMDEGTSEPMLETDDLQEAVKYFKRVEGLQVAVGGSVWFKGAEVVLPPQDRPQRQLVYVTEEDGMCVVSTASEGSRDGLVDEIARVPLTDAQKAYGDGKIDPAFEGGAEQCLTRALMLYPGVAKSFLFEITQALQCVRQAKKKIEVVAPWLDVLPIEYRNKPSFPGNYAKEAMRLLG